jgi:excisionase family DNA binding protein
MLPVPLRQRNESSKDGVVEVGVDEAAERAGVSQHRLRYLIHAGELPARRVAGRWVLETDAVDRYAEYRQPGRPLSPRKVWGLIDLLQSGRAPDLSAPDRSRLRARLRAGPSLEELARLGRRRAKPLYLRVHPGALPRALEWDGAVPAGASASGHDIVDPARVEIYLPGQAVGPMSRALRARPASPAEANLVVRVPAGPRWPFPDGKAGPVAVALDLWEAGDSRSRRAAERLYRAAHAARRYDPPFPKGGV